MIVVASFSCSYAPEHTCTRNHIISETPADYVVILVHKDMHLLNFVLKLCALDETKSYMGVTRFIPRFSKTASGL